MSYDQRVCSDVADVLAGYDELEFLPVGVKPHVESCLRCQAELVGFRRLRKSMLDLADVPVPVDPSLQHRIMFALDGVDHRAERRVIRATAVTLGGLAAAAGVFVVASKQIRSLRMAG